MRLLLRLYPSPYPPLSHHPTAIDHTRHGNNHFKKKQKKKGPETENTVFLMDVQAPASRRRVIHDTRSWEAAPWRAVYPYTTHTTTLNTKKMEFNKTILHRCFGHSCPPPSSAGRWPWKHIHAMQPREDRYFHTHPKPRWVKKKWKIAIRTRSNTINSERWGIPCNPILPWRQMQSTRRSLAEFQLRG